MAKKSFAQQFAELEAIAAWFEKEDGDVEEGVKKFEEGLALAEACKKRLQEIENKVEEVKNKYSGIVPEV